MLKNILSFIITGLRPLFGPAQCRYALGCTEFARLQLANESLPYASIAIVKRILSCNPFINVVRIFLFGTMLTYTIHAQEVTNISWQFENCDKETILSLPKLKQIIQTIADDIKTSLNGDAQVEYNADGYILLQLLKNKSYVSLSAYNEAKKVYVGMHTASVPTNKIGLAKKIKELLKAASYKIMP